MVHVLTYTTYMYLGGGSTEVSGVSRLVTSTCIALNVHDFTLFAIKLDSFTLSVQWDPSLGQILYCGKAYDTCTPGLHC